MVPKKPKKDTQKELFDEFGEVLSPESDSLQLKAHSSPILSLSLDKLLICVVIMVLCLFSSYILGYYKGKSTQYVDIASKPAPEVIYKAPEPIESVIKESPEPEPKPTPEPATKSVAKSINKPYTIQLGAFRNSNLALKNAKALKVKGYDPRVISQGSLYIVCAGQYANRKGAKDDLTKIKAFAEDAFIRRN